MSGDLSRGRRLTDAFIVLSDTLVAEFDVRDFLGVLTHQCAERLDVTGVGVLLADDHVRLQVASASSDRVRAVLEAELAIGHGPCLECFGSGGPVQAALSTAGFCSVHALPMRLRADVIGAVGLFRDRPGGLVEEEARLGQALADVATIGILHERTIRQAEVLAGQLQVALDSRIVIEQAKGVLAERARLDMDSAFGVLRGYARSHQLRLADVAGQVVAGTIDTEAILGVQST